MNLSTVKWAQWDKTKARELLGLMICNSPAQLKCKQGVQSEPELVTNVKHANPTQSQVARRKDVQDDLH